MDPLPNARRGPFILVATALVAVSIIVVALPESLLEQVERNRPLTDAQAGWAYRLIAIVAAVQVAYGGFVVFRVDRIESARARDPEFATRSNVAVISSLARAAAAMVALTLVYGLATLAITGLRGGFWLFPVMAVAQAAWYYREIGEVARWTALQPRSTPEDPDKGAWNPRHLDHVPALARGMSPLDRSRDDAGDK